MTGGTSLTSEYKVRPVTNHLKEDLFYLFSVFNTLIYIQCINCVDGSVLDLTNLSSGIDGSVLVQAKETAVFARLRDIVVLDVDPKTIHKKVIFDLKGLLRWSCLS